MPAKKVAKKPAKKPVKKPAKKAAKPQSKHAGDLEWAIEAWAETRDPRLADLVDVISARLLAEAPRPVLGNTAKAADLAAWNATEARKDPADFPLLAAALGGGKRDEVVRKVKALAKWDDPRLGAGFLRLLEDPPFTGSKGGMIFTAVFPALTATRDARLPAACRELAGRYLGIISGARGGDVIDKLERVATELELVIPEDLSAADKKRYAALEASYKQELADLADKRTARIDATKSLDTLLAAVYAAPDDDGPRIVYADALLELGDDRGELIHLQLAKARGALTPEQAQREAAIIKERGPSLAQPLSNSGNCKLERGFPFEIGLYTKTATKLLGDPSWTTIRSILAIDRIAERDAIKILDHPSTAAVRSVATLGPNLAAAVATRERPWTHVRLAGDTFEPSVFRALPALRTIGFDFGRFPETAFFTELAKLEHVVEVDLHVGGAGTTQLVELAMPKTLRKLEIRIRTQNPTRIVPRLDDLEHAHVEIKTLPANALSAPRVRRLVVKTFELQDDALAGLEALESLELETRSTQPRGLAGLSKLRRLVLKHDKDTFIATGLFAHVPALTELDLDWSRSFDPAELAALHELEYLRSRCMGIEHMPALPKLRRAAVREPDESCDFAHVFARVPALQRLEFCLGWGPLEVNRSGATNDIDLWPRFAEVLSACPVPEVVFNDTVALSRDADGKLTRMRIEIEKGDRHEVKLVTLVAKAFGKITSLENPNNVCPTDIEAAVAQFRS